MSADSRALPSSSGALWYRHWLELRGPIRTMLIFGAGLVLFFPIAVHGYSSFLAETGKLAGDILAIGPAVDRVPPAAVVPWAVHVHFLALFTVVAPLLLSSFGWLGWGGSRSRGAPLFTWSLPVSRLTFVLTRVTSVVAVAAATVALLLAVHAVTLLLINQSLSLVLLQIATMVPSAIRATALVSVFLVAVALAMAVFDPHWVTAAAMCAMWGAFAWAWPGVQGFIAGATWNQVAVTFAIAAVLSVAAAVLTRMREHR